MIFAISLIFTVIFVAGLIYSIRKKMILGIIIFVSVLLCSGYLTGSSFLLMNRLDKNLPVYGEGGRRIEITSSKLLLNGGSFSFPRIKGGTYDTKRMEKVLNKKILSNIMALRNDNLSSLDGHYELSFFNGTILGVRFIGDSLSAGAPYPNKIDGTLYYDIRDGKIYSFNDLMNGNSGYIEGIKALIKKNETVFRVKDGSSSGDWTYEDFVKAWDNQEAMFRIVDKDHIILYFFRSNAAGFASGYELSFKDLSEMVDTSGAFYKGIKMKNPVDLSKTKDEGSYIIRY